MRILAGCLLFAAAGAILAPGPEDLRKRYGASECQHRDESGNVDIERFAARPGISLTGWYGSDGRVCRIDLAPSPSNTSQGGVPRFMSSESVSEILEEVSPATVRGEEVSRGSFQASCGVGNVVEYENVSIMRGSSACVPAGSDRDTSTTIYFLRNICPKPNDSVRTTPPPAKTHPQ
jgi:hypothetical protein